MIRKTSFGAFALFVSGCVSALGAAQAEQLFKHLRISGGIARWQPELAGRAITLRYAFTRSTITDTSGVNCRVMSPVDGLARQVKIQPTDLDMLAARAFDTWSAVTGIRFEPVEEAGQAHIVIGAMAEPIGFAFTNVSTENVADGKVAEIKAARICLNPLRRWKSGYDGDLAVYDIQHTLMHEIGHALGLDHPADRAQIMSFRYHEKVIGLAGGDAEGAKALYAEALLPATGQPDRQEVASPPRVPQTEKALGKGSLPRAR